VQLVVHPRRFVCEAPTCPRQIIVEPFPGGFAPSARQTERLCQVLSELAHASQAEMAVRLARWRSSLVSPDTPILRQRAELLVLPRPRGWGVDEFALRRGGPMLPGWWTWNANRRARSWRDARPSPC
jgi:hypothetical protein